MSVITATEDAFHEHPMLILGGLAVGVLLIFYLKNRGSSASGQPANFTFSYGPSDASIKAGTDLAIAQAGNNAALAAANLNATTETTIAGDYFSYLTGANNNAKQIATQKQGLDYSLASTQSSLAYNQNEYEASLLYNAGNASSITQLKQQAVS